MEHQPMCCGKPMIIAGNWIHCQVESDHRFIQVPYGKQRMVIAEMLTEHVQEFMPMWKELQPILHELWREGTYDDYDAKVPDKWRP